MADSPPKNYWNHRILVTKDGDDLYYSVHEVYYENGVPNGSTKEAIRISSESPEGIRWTLDMIKLALDKPFIWGDDRFPEEVKL